MKKGEYKNIYRNEESHFFYKSVHDLIFKLIKQYVRRGRTSLKILDAGCGTGLLAKKLTRLGGVSAFDYSEEALKYTKLRGIKPIKASVEKIPFKENLFDVVTCIDVLYHSNVLQDKKALSELYRVLRPGGVLILRVQANEYLASSHDVIIESARRYNKSDLREKIVNVGFSPQKISYMHMTLFPLALIKAGIDKTNNHKHGSSISEVPGTINRLLNQFLRIENELLLRFNLPIGVGLIAVCKKPSDR